MSGRRVMSTVVRGIALAASLALVAAPARADDEQAKAQAKEIYNFGARAFEAGQFRAAAKAFEEAHRLVPRSALLFSAGQALRRQYAVDHKPEDLKRAVVLYQRYVADVKEGGRVGEAAAALAELEPTAERLGLLTADAAAPPEPVTEPGKPTSAVIMVSSSVKGATATLDGQEVDMPLSAEVPPGKHVVRLSAVGYKQVEREVQVAAGASFAIDIPLEPKPARLTIDTSSSAEVTVDGRPYGSAPLPGALELQPGTRRVVLTQTGHHPFVTDLSLVADEEKTLPVELDATLQRQVSYAFFGIGGAGVTAGLALAGIAVLEQGRASKIDAAREAGNITEDDRLAYGTAVDRRDDFRRLAGFALSAGALVAGTGLLLFVFDSPAVEDPPKADEGVPPAASPAIPEPPGMELSLAPAAVDAEAGVSLLGRF